MNRRVYGASICLPALLLFGGCASPGTPRPPSLNLPEVVGSLSADRVGDSVRLGWSTSGRTTDGLEVHGTMRAEVCREVAGTSPAGCLPVLRIPVSAGSSEATDRLPASLTQATAQVIVYRVRILNALGRSAGSSPSGFTASGPAPATIRGLRAEPTEQGVVLSWQSEGAADAVELERTRPFADISPMKKETGLARSQTEPVAVRLEGTSDAERAGGVLDRTAKLGQPYTYTAQRVRRLSVDDHAVELRSAVSSEVTITLRDVFPTRQPSGLVAIFGTDGVDLSWEPNVEADLAGYLVYRRDEGTTTRNPAALNTMLLTAPAFHDPSVANGHTYRYTVVAVDRAGNRSTASEPVVETVRVP